MLPYTGYVIVEKITDKFYESDDKGKVLGSSIEDIKENDVIYFNKFEKEIDGKLIVKQEDIIAYERN